MTPEQQRIAIAEACGWKMVKDHPDYMPYWEDPNGNMIAIGIYGNRFPDYLNDLNAMHEAEKMLIEKDRSRYTDNICGITPCAYDGWFSCAHATAAKRAEAFLRTIGKWTTNPNER